MKRLLSVDGGGIRGVLPLALLVEIETRAGKPCADLFDMMTGTSIGGIIATGLAHRVPAKTLYRMLVDQGGTIFAKTWLTGLWSLIGPKYSAAPLEKCLAQQLGSTRLSDIVGTELLVPACDLIRGDTIFFKSWRARKDLAYDFALRDIARATSAAETYFAPADVSSYTSAVYKMIDGGTAINNPTVAAILEADQLWPGEELKVLSIGTGMVTEEIAPKNGGIFGWLPFIPGIFMDFQASVLNHMAEWAIPGVTRCDIALGADANHAFDDASPANLTALAALGQQLISAEIGRALAIWV